MSRPPRRPSGVALITALLITALATVAAVAMASRQNLELRRTANILEFDQAYLFSLAVESWAKEVLVRDLRNGTVDHPKEAWATILPPIEVEGATVSGRIEDLQGRFNLNNLVDNAGKPSEQEIARFQRLLQALELDPRLADAVVDWIDPDSEPRFPDGAEEQFYLDMNPSYRPANAPMSHPSELLLVRGFTPEVYNQIAPHVWTLPVKTAVNLNTATAPVLMALIEGLKESEAEQLIADRGDKGYQTVEEFLAHPILKERQLAVPGVAVSTSWFLIHGNVRYERNQVNLHSVVTRAQNARVTVVSRSQGTT
jgi:general secretion pathway protein K